MIRCLNCGRRGTLCWVGWNWCKACGWNDRLSANGYKPPDDTTNKTLPWPAWRYR